MSRLEAEFSLTPSARSRINVPMQPKEVLPDPKGYFTAG